MITFRGGQQLANGRRTGLGSGFGGVIAYLTQGRREELELAAEAADRVAWTNVRNLPVDDPDQAAYWMRAWADQSPRVKKPVYHFGASLPPDEHLSREQWGRVADRLLEGLGLEEHQAILALHTDRDHEHIHIAVNRVGPDGRAWAPSFDALKQQDAARELERELGLRIVPTKRDLALEQRKASGAHLERREVEKPFARRVAIAALEDFRQSGTWEELEDRLARHGLRLEPAKRGGGINVTDGHERAGVARIDRTLSGPRLADRYGETLRQYRERVPDRPPLECAFERPDVTPDLPIEERAESLLRHLAAQRATWTEADLRRLTNRDLDGDALLRQALESDRVVSVGTDPRGHERFAAGDYIAAEERMFSAGDRLAGRADLQLVGDRVGALLEERFTHLSHEQREAVVHATTKQDLALIVGRAGAGKTRLTRAVVDAYHEAGYQVRGAALAGKAAEGLAAEAGIEARTLASYELGWRNGSGVLDSRDVLLVDEAGMVDVRQMRRVLEHAAERGAKVALIGDPDQLKAIGPGDAFRGLIEQHGAARVDTIRRQAEEWQRRASEHLADGRLEVALSAYTERGAIQWHTDPAQAREALVMRYFEDRYLAPDQSSLVLAYRNVDVRRLNEQIREVRRAAGELGSAVRLKGRELAAGDRVLFLRNDHTGRHVRTLEGQGRGVKNGALGTLLEAEPDRLRVRLDSGRLVELDPLTYDRLTHGYAATVHKAQGATVDRAYVLADRGFDRNLSYVALTRHRHQLALYVDQETFASGDQLRRAFAREPRKDLVRDYSPASAADLTLEPLPAEKALDEGWLPPVEPAARELTPERLDRLQHALRQLDQWDEISARLSNVDQARRQLPYGGSLSNVRLKIRELERMPWKFDRDLGRVYRQPETAWDGLRRHAQEHGAANAFRHLRDTPEVFGRIHGRQILTRPTRARVEAHAIAQRVGSDGVKRCTRAEGYRERLATSERYRNDLIGFDRQLGALAPSRDALADNLRAQSAGLDLQLDGRLPANQLETLRDLQRSDERELRPLREALEAFHRAHRSRAAEATAWHVARRLTTILGMTPRTLLRRLTPPQMRLLLSAASAAAAVVRKLSPEYEQTKTRRRVLSI